MLLLTCASTSEFEDQVYLVLQLMKTEFLVSFGHQNADSRRRPQEPTEAVLHEETIQHSTRKESIKAHDSKKSYLSLLITWASYQWPSKIVFTTKLVRG